MMRRPRSRGLASRLRAVVTIQEMDMIDNGRGGRRPRDPAAPWRDVERDVPAEIIPLRGGEALENLVLRATQLWRVAIRARGDLTTSNRLTWTDPIIGEVNGDIRSVVPDEDGAGIVMTIESGKA